jgi:hypothetical protein
MKKYIVRVTETINHEYIIEADSPEEAEQVYYSYEDSDLQNFDIDGQAMWDTHPYDIDLCED